MCLFTRNKKFVTESDIICYKVFEMTEEGQLITPFQYMPMDINKTYEDKNSLDLQWSDGEKNLWVIEGGMFHAFRMIQDAAIMMWDLTEGDEGYAYEVVECIIPKGTEYYIGRGGQITSKKIVLKRIMKADEIEKTAIYSINILNEEISCFFNNKTAALLSAKDLVRKSKAMFGNYGYTIKVYEHQFGEKKLLEEVSVARSLQ